MPLTKVPGKLAPSAETKQAAQPTSNTPTASMPDAIDEHDDGSVSYALAADLRDKFADAADEAIKDAEQHLAIWERGMKQSLADYWGLPLQMDSGEQITPQSPPQIQPHHLQKKGR